MKAILQGQMPLDDTPKEGSKYPVTSDGVWNGLQRKPNPNLLDNWYFVNPVNQRGKTEYNFDSFLYSIDRWKSYSCKVVLKSDGIELTSKVQNGELRQVLSENALSAIKGRTVTLSVLLDIGLFSQTAEIPKSDNFDLQNPLVGVSKWYFDMFTSDGQRTVNFRIINSVVAEDEPITVIAAKLELGNHQTLAHQDADGNWVLNDPPPDYGTELAKCQRYQQPCGVGFCQVLPGKTSISVAFPFNVPMRAVPNISIKESALGFYDGSNITFNVTGIKEKYVTSEGIYYLNLVGTFDKSITEGTWKISNINYLWADANL